jgi:hypothetical protein
VEIWRISVQGQTGQKVSKTPPQPIPGVVAHTCHPSYIGNINRYRQKPKLHPPNKTKRSRGMAQVIERLSSKSKILNSNPSTTKKRLRQQNEQKCSHGALLEE